MSHLVSKKEERHLKSLTISASRRLPGKDGLWGMLGAARASTWAVLAAVCSKQASASPRPGLSLGSGEKADCHGDPGGADTAGPSPSPAPSSGWTTAVAAGEEAS